MNTKSILFASCVAAITLTASVAMAGRHGGGFGGGGPSGRGFRGSSAHAGMAPGFARGGSRFGSGFSRGFRGDRDFHHRRDFVFFGDFGDPFFFYPYYSGYYPYGYYPYGYYPYGDYPYGYGYGSDNQAVYPSVAVGRGSSVRKIQLRLARAGFYHGPIDGIMGARTRSAIRAYERSRVTER